MKKIELANIECTEYCLLDLKTGRTKFYKDQPTSEEFTGLYYKNEDLFFALFPTSEGPMIYYDKKCYPITRELNIQLTEGENCGEFIIPEYQIDIKYRYSRYLGFDDWSRKEDIDIFYILFSKYKNDSFYVQYTHAS